MSLDTSIELDVNIDTTVPCQTHPAWHLLFGTGPAEWRLWPYRCCDRPPVTVLACDGCKRAFLESQEIGYCSGCRLVFRPVRAMFDRAERL